MSYYFSDLHHLYVHWPFCPYKCHFCDFVAMASHEQFMIDYHHALLKEIEQFIPYRMSNSTLQTIYLGGGTPSTYPANLLLDMFAILKKHFYFDQTTEVTIEVNPGTASKELLDCWYEIGINRLSIGVQSLKDVVLKSLNRHQTAQDVEQILKWAQSKFHNISVDFIIGLPGVSDDEWKVMIEQAMSWPITHISVYFLMVHENTPLYFKVQSKKMNLPPDDAVVDLYDWTVATLQKHGFDRYELSNFAKPNFESRHNAAYWDRKSYKGFGLGACSFNGKTRFQNIKNLGQYLLQLHSQVNLIEMSEYLKPSEIALEKIMLGLRQKKGLVVEEYLKDLSVAQQKQFLDEMKTLQQTGFLEKNLDIVRLTPKGYALENEIALRLFS